MKKVGNMEYIDVLMQDRRNQKKLLRIRDDVMLDIPKLAEVVEEELRCFQANRLLMRSDRETDDLCSYLSILLRCPVFTGCIRLENNSGNDRERALCLDAAGKRIVSYELLDNLTLITVKDKEYMNRCIESSSFLEIKERTLSYVEKQNSSEQIKKEQNTEEITEERIAEEKIIHKMPNITIKMSREKKKAEKKGIDEAPCIVAGGRAFGSPERFQTIISFAGLLGAEYATSRPNVDAGWIGKDRQVGLSGRTVAPETYIACGISGSAHHTIGMSGSQWVMAINIDRNEPIFDIADVGIIGDANQILKRVMEKYF